MPFEPINFAGIAPQGNPAMRDFVSNLAAGYQAGRLPYETAQSEQKNQLANAMSQLLLKQQPQKFQSEMTSADLAHALAKIKLQEEPQSFSSTQGYTKALTNEILQKMAIQKQDQDRLNAFRKMLSQANSPDESQSISNIPSQNNVNALQINGNQENIPLDQANEQIVQNASSISVPGQVNTSSQSIISPQSTQASSSYILAEGNPRLRKVDKMYINNPQYEDEFKKMGLQLKRELKFNPQTGQAFSETTYPSGRIEINTIPIGESPQAIAREKKIGSADAEVYSKALDASSGAQNALSNLDYVNNILQNNPEFENVVGPVSSWLTKYAGSEKDRELLGNLNTAVGNVVLDAAKSIKGAFTGRDMGLINSVKPSTNDFSDVFRGKLNAMRLLATYVDKRNSLIANYVRQGMDPNDAMQLAKKQTDFNQIESQINTLKKGTQSPQQIADLVKAKSFNNKQEFVNYLASLTPDRRNKLKQNLLENK